jgi:HEAT repeat protein
MLVSLVSLVTVASLVGLALPVAIADEAMDKAFDALKTLDWGTDLNVLKPIEDAIVSSHKDAEARKALAARLATVLTSDATYRAKDFACRRLSLIGSAESVPALAALLTDPALSHMARYALERMPCSEAGEAIRNTLPKVQGKLKVGIINSLGVRRDAASTDALLALLGGADRDVTAAAAVALGAIGTPKAAKALGDFQGKAPKELRMVAVDAYLTCAEHLLAAGKKAEAKKIYTALGASKYPKHVRLAAENGLTAVEAKK